MSIKEAQLKRLSLFGTVVALSLVISGVVLAQSNPSVGTWKLNLAKSHYSPGPPPKSQTVVNEANGNGIKSTTTGTAADGSAVSYSYTVTYGDKDYPETGTGTPNGADTIAIKRINANAFESTSKRAGNVVQTNRTVYSNEGKLRTITSKGTNQNGQPTNNVSVYDKQ
jgi:hypothetical protein